MGRIWIPTQLTGPSVKSGWGVGRKEAGRTAEPLPRAAVLVLRDHRKFWLQGVIGSYSFPNRIALRVWGGILRKEFFLGGSRKKDLRGSLVEEECILKKGTMPENRGAASECFPISLWEP